jgi:hypothetical protein
MIATHHSIQTDTKKVAIDFTSSPLLQRVDGLLSQGQRSNQGSSAYPL